MKPYFQVKPDRREVKIRYRTLGQTASLGLQNEDTKVRRTEKRLTKNKEKEINVDY